MNIEQLRSFKTIISARNRATDDFLKKSMDGCDSETLKTPYGLAIREGFRDCFQSGWDKAVEYFLEAEGNKP